MIRKMQNRPLVHAENDTTSNWKNAVKSDVKKLLKKNSELNQLDAAKVSSHVQRESGDWFVNTLMLEGYPIAFKYNRKKLYKNLKGASVNLTYYPETEQVAGMDFEYMKVVRIRRS